MQSISFTLRCVVPFSSVPLPTCKPFDITNICQKCVLGMCEFESPHKNVYIWNRDLIKVRHTCVRDIIPHVQASHMPTKWQIMFFSRPLAQGNAFGLDIECPTLLRCMKGECSIKQLSKRYTIQNSRIHKD